MLADGKTYVIISMEEINMPITTATSLRKTLYKTLDGVVTYGEPITVTSKAGNAVIISESDYNALMETVYLTSQPGVLKEYKEAKKQDKKTYKKYDPKEEW